MKRALAFVSLLSLLGLVALSCDPVHDNAVSSLGGETPGVAPGPLHRPGQPCLLCHDGQGNDPPAFALAGTIFLDANSPTPAVGATVSLMDASGKTASQTTNAAGNFYFDPATFSPKFPVHVTGVAMGGVSVVMHSHIGGNGSCAGCHADPAGPDSPGHVYLQIVGTSP
jgi:hypothetical protein